MKYNIFKVFLVTLLTTSGLKNLSRYNKHRIPFARMSASSLPTNEEGWRTILNPSQFKVLRQKATEPSGYSEGTPGALEYDLKKNLGTKIPKEVLSIKLFKLSCDIKKINFMILWLAWGRGSLLALDVTLLFTMQHLSLILDVAGQHSMKVFLVPSKK